MPAATQVDNADIFPIVQGGANKSAAKEVFLRHQDPEDMEIGGPDSFLRFGPAGLVQIVISATANLEIVREVAGVPQDFIIFNGSEIAVQALTRLSIFVDGGNRVIDISAGNPIQISYDYEFGVWFPGGNSDLVTAVDRIARAVAGLLGTLIPL